MPTLSLAWYLNRLRSMEAGEIPFRISEQFRRLTYRNYREGFERFRLADGPLPVLPGLAEKLRRAAPYELDANISNAAGAARNDPFNYLGAVWPACIRDSTGRLKAELWHLDPVSGQGWEGAQLYCFDINYRHRPGWGDVKHVWEVNRLQFLQPVAVDALRRGYGPEAARWMMEIVRSWMASNPPFRGVNWRSGIELGLRATTIVIAVSALGRDALTESDRADLRTLLNAHGFWLARFPSAYSSANNHLVMEALGLFLIGLLVPDLPASAEWAEYGRQTLEREVSIQILDDGIGAEQSPNYTAFTLEAYLLAILAADHMGRPLGASVIERVARAGEALRWFMDDGGNVPEIGDNDAGRVIAMGQPPETRYVASVAAAVAAVTHRREAMPPARLSHLRDLIFGTTDDEAVGARGLRVFESGGYSVWRGGIADHDAVLVFDHGPLGFLTTAAHGHADTLAIWLHLGNRPIIVDAGTYLYYSTSGWRDHFRSTAAHNAMTVEGRSSSTRAGSFNWRKKAKGRLVSAAEDGDGRLVITGAHDGFADRYRCTHTRIVTVDRKGLIVTDRLDSPVELQVEIGFNLHPALEVREASDVFEVRSDGLRLLRIAGPAGFGARALRGSDTPPAGWYSPHFGAKSPLTRVLFSGALVEGRSATVTIDIGDEPR